MKLAFQHKVDRLVGIPACRMLSWYARLRKPAPALQPDANILVILLSEMGSLVLANPLFSRLKSLFPQARLHALVFERNRRALELMGLIAPSNILTVSDRKLGRFIKNSLKAVGDMRRIGIDLAIDAELFARISSIFSFLSGAGTRVGFHPHSQEGLYRGDFINRPVLYNPYQHFSAQLLSLAEAISSTTTPKNKAAPAKRLPAPPQIPVAAGDIQKMRGRLADDFPQMENRRLVLIHPGGGILPIRAWPQEHYLDIVRQLTGRGFAVGIIGLGLDKPLAAQLITGCGHKACIDLTGYTRDIHELIHLFHLADLLITNDGGPGHFAALTPIAAIVLFGPESPLLYKPLGDKTVIFYEPTACSPCLTAYNHRRSPCDGDNLCLRQIAPHKVLQKALELLNR